MSRVSRMLADEFGTASNIKSRVNRQSVLGAITSVQQRLKLYSKGMQTASSIQLSLVSAWPMDVKFGTDFIVVFW